MIQRYFNPLLGRFLSVDPAASEFNRYSYGANNPYTFVDPDGRVAKGQGSSNNLCLIGGCDAGSFSASSSGSQKQETAKEPTSWIAQQTQGSIFEIAGQAIATDIAYLVGAATDNQALQDVAVQGFQEKVGADNAVLAVVLMAVSPRSGGGTKIGTAPDFIVTPGGTALAIKLAYF